MLGWDGPHVIIAVGVTVAVLTVELLVRGDIWKRAIPQLHGRGAISRWVARLVWVYGLGLAAPITGIYVGLSYALASLLGAPSGTQIVLVGVFAITAGVCVNVMKDLLLMHRKHGELRGWVSREGLNHVAHEGRASESWRGMFVDKVKTWKDLDILVVTGLNTLGATKALLAEYMERPNPGRLRVLLLSPESEEFEKRASRLGRTKETQFSAMRTTLAQLEKLRRRKGNVEYRFYDGNPIWRLYMGSGEAFFQHVAYSEQDANQPIYSIEAASGSFYSAFLLYFETQWEGAKEDPGGATARTIKELKQGAKDEGSGLLDIKRMDAEREYRVAVGDPEHAPTQRTSADSFDFRHESDTDSDMRVKRPRKSRRNFDN